MSIPYLINFSKKGDLRGNLVPIEQYKDIPFEIKRIFYIKNMDDFPRGFHGHKECDQILIAINGSFKVDITNSKEKSEAYELTKSNMGLYFPRYHWLKMYDFSADCIILVLCSSYYDENEYIRNYGDFLEYVNLRGKEVRDEIKFFDLSKNTQLIRKEVDEKITKIINNSEFVLGKDLELFEKNFAEYHQIEYCVGVSDGTNALICALKSLELSNGDEIIVQSNTYIAAPIAIDYCNLKIKIVDIDESLNLDLEKLENNITSKTKCIILVHLYGNCCDMDRLMKIKNKHNIFLIEDAAQAHGSEYLGKKLGTFGDVGCFSFYPSKNLGSYGEGGCIITKNKEIYEKIKRMRNYGSVKKYEWDIKGSNQRMHNIQAGILNVKLPYLDEWNCSRNKIAKIYDKELSKIKNITVPKRNTSFSNYHLYIILTDQRQDLVSFLKKNNINTAIHYPETFYKSKAYQEYNNLNFIADEMKNKLLSLPMYPEMPLNDVYKVTTCLKEFF